MGPTRHIFDTNMVKHATYTQSSSKRKIYYDPNDLLQKDELEEVNKLFLFKLRTKSENLLQETIKVSWT